MTCRKRSIRMLQAAQQKSAKRSKKCDSDAFSLPDMKIFNNKKDQRQFETIYHAVNSSKMSKKLQLPSCIISEISEFAIGTVYPCKNRKCSNRIIVLNEDFNSKLLTKNVHDKYMEQNAYCSQCKVHCKQCEYCDVPLYRPCPNKCSRCNLKVIECGKCSHWDHCDECRDAMCADCANIFIIRCGQKCRAEICGECQGNVEKKCSRCGHKEIFQHKRCPIVGDYECYDGYHNCSHFKCDKLICNSCHEKGVQLQQQYEDGELRCDCKWPECMYCDCETYWQRYNYCLEHQKNKSYLY